MGTLGASVDALLHPRAVNVTSVADSVLALVLLIVLACRGVSVLVLSPLCFVGKGAIQ
jgi:hypothetical protein